MPNQDTVLTSICVVVQRCEALYQIRAQSPEEELEKYKTGGEGDHWF